MIAIDDAQVRLGVSGALLEIGVYYGASAILLGFFRRRGEHFVVCDTFGGLGFRPENQLEREEFSRCSQRMFEGNYLRFHSRLPEVIAGPSSAIRAEADSFRLVHVDGSHAYDDVRRDIALSRELLGSGGVVVVDDAIAPHLPGVAAAVWSAVVHDGLRPFALGRKLYASWDAPPCLEVASVATGLGGEVDWSCHDVAGHRLVRYFERS